MHVPALQRDRLREVLVGVALQEPPVLISSPLAEASTALAAVALNPLLEVGAQRDRRALLQLAAVAVGLALPLDPARLVERSGELLALATAGAVDHDVRPTASVYARRLRSHELALVGACSVGGAHRRTLGVH